MYYQLHTHTHTHKAAQLFFNIDNNKKCFLGIKFEY